MDSLRSIAEDLEKTIRLYEMDVVPVNTGGWLREVRDRLLALCDEAEKTDLVQKLRTPIDYVSCLGDTATVANQVRAQIADELATWLAARGIQP